MGPAVDPTANRQPPEPGGFSEYARHNRGGVGVDSLMHAFEHTAVGVYDLGQFTLTFLTQYTTRHRLTTQ